MPVTVREATSYDDYSAAVDTFQTRMQQSGTKEGTARADMSDERSKGSKDVRRFVATNDHGLVIGWMILKINESDLKIEGICADYVPANKEGVSKALVATAVNASFQMGKGGTLTLTDASKGSGTRFYNYVGFKTIDGDKMRLTLPSRSDPPSDGPTWHWEESGAVATKKGTLKQTQLVFS